MFQNIIEALQKSLSPNVLSLGFMPDVSNDT